MTVKKKQPHFDRNAAFAEIMSTSAMRVKLLRSGETKLLNYVRMDLSGMAAKLPSVANNRLLHVPKNRVLGLAANAQLPHFRGQLMKELKQMRPQSSVNPRHQVYLDALTVLWQRAVEKLGGVPSFDDTKKDRLFMLVLLADSCIASDSHNLSKGFCDWTQQVGLVKNDRHLDCFPIPKRYVLTAGLNYQETTMILVRSGVSAKLLATLTEQMLGYGTP